MSKQDLYEMLPDKAKEIYCEFCAYAINSGKDYLIKNLKKLSIDYSRCKSPIETIFCMAFDIIACFRDPDHWYLDKQYEVVVDDNKRYYLDFAYIGNNFKIAIECDGHDFHQKTKEQVCYGNDRDYELQRLDFYVFHFSGSEIFNDPLGCATKVMRFISKKEGWG